MADSVDGTKGASDEFFDPYCDICAKAKNLNVRPEGYCYDCNHCLCKDCLPVHSNLPSTTDHKISTGEDIPKSHADKPPKFEYCEYHHHNQKDRYCIDHRVLICTLCVPLNHKDCPVKSVECLVKSMPSSEIDRLYHTVSDFKSHLLVAESNMKGNATDLKDQRNQIFEEIQKMYDKTMSKVDTLFQDIKSQLEVKYHSQLSALARNQKTINDVSLNLESTLDDINDLKGSNIDSKAFLKLQNILKRIDKCKMDVSSLNQTTTKGMLNFIPDKTMNNFLSSSFTPGTISLEESNCDVTICDPEIMFPSSPTRLSHASAAGYQSSGTKKPISEKTVQKHTKYNIKLRDDTYDCDVTGMSITLDRRRLLADFRNKKIKMFSCDMKLLSSLSLSAPPCDIAVTGVKEAVVSVYGESKLFIVDVSDKRMSVRRTVKLSFEVFAIATCKDKLVGTSLDPNFPSVKVINQSGKIYWSTSSDQQIEELFSRPWYVTCYDDRGSSTVIVTNWGNNTLTLLNSDTGGVTNRRLVERKGPRGVTTDTAGNIFVCYYSTDEVALLSKDFSEEKIILTRRDGISGGPQATAHDAEDHQLLVAYYCRNDVDCFHLL